MAETTIAITAKLNDNATQGLQGLKQTVSDMGVDAQSMANKVSVAGAGIVSFCTTAVYAAMASEKAWIA